MWKTIITLVIGLIALALNLCSCKYVENITWTSSAGPVYRKGLVQFTYNSMFGLYGGIVWPLAGNNETDEVLYPENGKVANSGRTIAYTNGFTIGSELFIPAGRNNFQAQATLFKVNLDNHLTYQLASMHDPRIRPAVGYWPDGTIIVAGGYQSTVWDNLDTAEIYNPINNTWRYLPNLPFGRSAHASGIVIGSYFYLFGGADMPVRNNAHVRSYNHGIWRIDKAGTNWTQVGTFVEDNTGGAIVQVNDHAYYIGGHSLSYGYNDRVWRIDFPATGPVVANQMPNLMPERVNDIEATLCDPKTICVYGGENEDYSHSRTSNLIKYGRVH